MVAANGRRQRTLDVIVVVAVEQMVTSAIVALHSDDCADDADDGRFEFDSLAAGCRLDVVADGVTVSMMRLSLVS